MIDLLLVLALVAGSAFFIFFVIRIFVTPKHINQIRGMIESGNVKQAINVLKVILSKNANNLEAHWLLAEAYFKDKRYDLSLVECRYISKLGKFSNEVPEEKVRARLAGLLEYFGHLEDAQKEYILLSKLRPDYGEYYFKIGEIFYKRNMTDKSIPYFNTALKYSPAHPETLFYLGIINYAKSQVKEAITYLNKALQFNPNLHKAHYYLGLINKTLGVYDKARTEFQLSQKDPDFKLRAMLEEGRILLITENVKEAIIQFERALKFIKEENEISIEIRYLLGLCYEKTKDLSLAVEQWEIVDNHRKGYKDVGIKLSLYSDLRTDDRLKDFLTASRQGFIELSQKVLAAMGFEIQDTKPINDDAVDFVVSQLEGKWRNTKRSSCLVKIRRSSEPVGELLVRQIQEEMKKISASRGIIISTAGFAPSAVQYSLTRPIDLIDRQQLTQTLHSIQG